MLTIALALLAVSLPFGFLGPLFYAGFFPLNAAAAASLLAVAVSIWEAVRRNARPDGAGWSAIAWASAWVVCSLAAPSAWQSSSQEAWRLATGPLIFACARPAIRPQDRRAVFAGLVVALAVATARSFSSGNWPLIPVLPSAIPWPAFLASPLTGAGPGSFPNLPLWAGLLPQGGLLAASAGALLLWSLARGINGKPRRPGPRFGRLAPALLLGLLVMSGLFINPLASVPWGAAFWLLLAVLIPAHRPAYNRGRKA